MESSEEEHDEPEKPFAAVRFAEEKDGEIVILLEVINSKWLILGEDGQYSCYWPPDSFTSSQKINLVKKLSPAENSWTVCPCDVVNYYDDYLSARTGAKKRVEDSSYETDKEMGRGKRKKKVPEKVKETESDDSDMFEDNSNTFIPPPPSFPTANFADIGDRPKPKSPVKIVSSGSSRSSHSEKNKSALAKVRGVRKSSSKVTSTDELRLKLLAAKEKPKSSVKPGHVSSLLDRIREKDKPNSPVKSTSPGKWEIRGNGATNKGSPTGSSKPTPKTSKRSSSTQLSPSSSTKKQKSTPSIAGVPESIKTAVSSSRADKVIDARKALSFSPRKQTETAEIPAYDDEDILSKTTQMLPFATPEKLSQTGSLEPTSFEREILRQVYALHEKVEIISMNQAKLNLHLLPDEKVLTRPPCLPTLPLKTVREFKEMEKRMEQDQDVVSATAIYLSSLVNKDPLLEKKSAMKIMAHLMSNRLASKFNLFGQRDKLPFIQSKLWVAIQGAIVLKIKDTDCSGA